jgi:succinate dehydrogenase flavin-adding protein (antitoxin of CptAB toxin-antitoxin module)
MNEIIHKEAAKIHFRIAKEEYEKFLEEKDKDMKKAIMIVAAQNYFYCSINIIEFIFAKEKKEHSFNHENRFRKLKENYNFFSEDFITLFDEVDRDLRNKVAYRAENGEKFKKLRKLAEISMELL